jgi:hypothetical protein
VDKFSISQQIKGYDRLISAYNDSERVKSVFDQASAQVKHWLAFTEYGSAPIESDHYVINKCMSTNEDECIASYFDVHPLRSGERICIDATGFIRPHLLFLVRYLYEIGWPNVDVLYSEPMSYIKGVKTEFSGDVVEVRQVRGFEGIHSIEPDGEFLIVGCGYDTNLMSVVANSRLRAKKIQMFPFPALRPHMYQENRLRTEECQSAFGAVAETCFAPGYDPFSTAHVLSNIVGKFRQKIKNLYLTPLATKAQVLGFGIFYLMESQSLPVSMIFPFSNRYNRETSVGLSELWRYNVDFQLLRSLQV